MSSWSNGCARRLDGERDRLGGRAAGAVGGTAVRTAQGFDARLLHRRHGARRTERRSISEHERGTARLHDQQPHDRSRKLVQSRPRLKRTLLPSSVRGSLPPSFPECRSSITEAGGRVLVSRCRGQRLSFARFDVVPEMNRLGDRSAEVLDSEFQVPWLPDADDVPP